MIVTCIPRHASFAQLKLCLYLHITIIMTNDLP